MAYIRRIEHRRNGSLISVLSNRNDIGQASFTLTAQRGCSGGKLSMAVEAGSAYVMDRYDEVRFMWDESTVWYSGFVSTRSRSERKFEQVYELRGFADYLAGEFLSDDEEDVVHFGNTLPDGVTSPVAGDNTVEAIVEWIWENRISPVYPEFTLDVIQPTGYSVEHIEFDSSKSLFEILEELSNLGSAEGVPCYFGVDQLKRFYFRRVTSTSVQDLVIQDPSTGLTKEVDREDYGEIYNVLVLSGGLDSTGNRLKAKYESDSSVARYRRRLKRIRKIFLLSYADMERWADGFFAKYSVPFESLTVEQYVDEDAPVLFKPWLSYIKVRSLTGGIQRQTPFLEVEYDFNTRPFFKLSVSRLEDDLVNADGSKGDKEDEPDDNEERIETPPTTEPSPTHDISIDKLDSVLTSEDGDEDEIAVVLTEEPVGVITVRMQGQINISQAEFTSAENDPVEVILEDVDGNGEVSVGFTLEDEPLAEVTISLTADGGIGISQSDLVFNAGNYDTPVVVTFTGITPGGTTAVDVSTDTVPDNDVVVDFEVLDKSEAVLQTSGDYFLDQLTFDNTDWDTPQTITAKGIDDDGTIEFSVKLNTQPSPSVDIRVRVTVTSGSTIPPYFVEQQHDFDFDSTNWDEEQVYTLVGVDADAAEFDVTMELAYPGEAATVIIDLVNTGDDDTEIDGNPPPITATFNSGTWGDPQTFEVTDIPTARGDGNIDYEISAVASSWDPNYNGMEKTIRCINIDNDSYGLTVTPLDNLETSESGANTDQEIRVVLNSEPTDFVDVNIVSSDPTSGIPSEATIRFETSDWNIPQTVTIEGQDDGIDGGTDKAYTVTLTAVSADGNYDALEVELSFNHNVDGAEGITNIVADDPGGDNTEFVVGGVSTSFNDTFTPDITDSNKLTGNQRFAEKTTAKVFQPGAILNLNPMPEVPQTAEAVTPIALVYTGGATVEVTFFWSTYDLVTTAVTNGSIVVSTSSAVGTGLAVFVGGSTITMPANPGQLFLRASVTLSGSATIISKWPQDGTFLRWNVTTAGVLNVDPNVTAIAIPVIGIIAN